MRSRHLVWWRTIGATALGVTLAVILFIKPEPPAPSRQDTGELGGIAQRDSSSVAPIARVDSVARQADPRARTMPIAWDDAHAEIITAPDEAALERGEVVHAARIEGGITVAQTMGLIDAPPEQCFRVVRDYSRYTETMPFTDESKVLRTFLVEGPIAPGAEAVDFWTRVNVGGLKTRYLLRIVHLTDPTAGRYRSYWTLVRDPDQAPCTDVEGKPCANDLAADIGSHLFEPYHGDPRRTRHTYTLTLVGRGWRKTLMTLDGGTSMKEVTRRIRLAAESTRENARPRP